MAFKKSREDERARAILFLRDKSSHDFQSLSESDKVQWISTFCMATPSRKLGRHAVNLIESLAEGTQWENWFELALESAIETKRTVVLDVFAETEIFKRNTKSLFDWSMILEKSAILENETLHSWLMKLYSHGRLPFEMMNYKYVALWMEKTLHLGKWDSEGDELRDFCVNEALRNDTLIGLDKEISENDHFMHFRTKTLERIKELDAGDLESILCRALMDETEIIHKPEEFLDICIEKNIDFAKRGKIGIWSYGGFANDKLLKMQETEYYVHRIPLMMGVARIAAVQGDVNVFMPYETPIGFAANNELRSLIERKNLEGSLNENEKQSSGRRRI